MILTSTRREWVTTGLLSIAGVAIATVSFRLIRDLLGKDHASLLYLPVIVLVARRGGTRAGLLSAVLAFLAWDFFLLPPYYTFVVSDPKDYLALAVFLLVGLLMGHQTGRMREREYEAVSREQESALLYRLSAHLAAQMAIPAMAAVLLEEVIQITGATHAVLWLQDESQIRGGPAPPLQPLVVIGSGFTESVARPFAAWSFEQGKAIGLPPGLHTSEGGFTHGPISVSLSEASEALQVEPTGGAVSPDRYEVFLPLQATSHAEGVLHVGGRFDGAPYLARDARLLVSISHLAAAFLERQRLQTLAAQADAIRQADRLKSTLISSVSHELKTPLASLTATVTNLLEGDVEWEPGALRGEIESLGQDLSRLNMNIGDLLDLSRLEAGAWEPRRDWHDLGEILGTVLARLSECQTRRISFDLPEGYPPIHVDYVQWARALQHLIENALAYSGPPGPVRVGAAMKGQTTEIFVEDQGPGVLSEERDRIFEKFYRGHASAAAPSGTGLGLAITHEIVRFHGGWIRVENVDPHGARFVIALPFEELCGSLSDVRA